ncbi:hypothetical protein C2E23DRAFT_859406 [Lenzites betulinus]|nr:hypothetical protein C2E23DRAFT_859406 [Lenzites betulinus]
MALSISAAVPSADGAAHGHVSSLSLDFHHLPSGPTLPLLSSSANLCTKLHKNVNTATQIRLRPRQLQATVELAAIGIARRVYHCKYRIMTSKDIYNGGGQSPTAASIRRLCASWGAVAATCKHFVQVMYHS